MYSFRILAWNLQLPSECMVLGIFKVCFAGCAFITVEQPFSLPYCVWFPPLVPPGSSLKTEAKHSVWFSLILRQFCFNYIPIQFFYLPISIVCIFLVQILISFPQSNYIFSCLQHDALQNILVDSEYVWDWFPFSPFICSKVWLVLHPVLKKCSSSFLTELVSSSVHFISHNKRYQSRLWSFTSSRVTGIFRTQTSRKGRQ